MMTDNKLKVVGQNQTLKSNKNFLNQWFNLFTF
jgi:hypothetical protein